MNRLVNDIDLEPVPQADAADAAEQRQPISPILDEDDYDWQTPDSVIVAGHRVLL